MHRSNKKSNAAGLRATEGARLHAGDQGLDFLERLRIQFVVNPAPVLPVADDSRVLEHAQMERQARLSGIERVGQLTDTPLAFAEQLDDLESGLVGEGVKQLDCTFGSGVGRCDHNSNISIKLVVSIRSVGSARFATVCASSYRRSLEE